MVTTQQSAREMVRDLMRLADGDTQVAVLRLAALFDQHLTECPHVEPPVGRAAPGLLEALEALLDDWEHSNLAVTQIDYSEQVAHFEAARAAIAKARGEAVQA